MNFYKANDSQTPTKFQNETLRGQKASLAHRNFKDFAQKDRSIQERLRNELIVQPRSCHSGKP